MKMVNFVFEQGGPYGNIISSIIEPVRSFLPISQISEDPIPEGVNVFFS